MGQQTQEQLFDKVRELLNKMKEEKEGKLYPGPINRMEPSSASFCKLFDELVNTMGQLSALNACYNYRQQLGSIRNHEIAEIDLFKYTYNKDARTPTQKSIGKMQGLMAKAIKEIELILFGIINDKNK
ncbi:MAG: hypothetical protein MJZ15_01335 [Bacteroidales bacterium]|nr:hypothetical protein [Bacteroidales bacterium]